MTGPVGIPGPFRIFLVKEKVHGELITEQRAVYQNNRAKNNQLRAQQHLHYSKQLWTTQAQMRSLGQPHASGGKKAEITLAMFLFEQVHVCLTTWRMQSTYNQESSLHQGKNKQVCLNRNGGQLKSRLSSILFILNVSFCKAGRNVYFITDVV